MKIILICISFVTCFLGYSQSNFVAVADKHSIGQKLSKTAQSVNSIQSDFVQEKYMDFLDVTLESKGKYWFKKENSIRWQYTEPYNYIVIISDGKINISDDGKNSEFKVKGNKIFERINYIIVASMKGEILESEDFEVAIFENNTYYLVKLKTLNKEIAEVIKEMEMYFEKNTLSISEIKMIEPNKDYILIRYKNKKINEPIPASIFAL